MRTTLSTPTRRAFAALTLVAALALVGVAFAMDVPFDPVAWGSNPALALLALTGFVAWLRTTPLGSRVDGPVLVPAVTLAIGALTGAALQMASFLTYAPYATMTSPLGGIAYGALIAASAITGISLFNYGASKVSRAAATLTQTALGHLMQLLMARFKGSIPGAAWTAIAPLLTKYAMSDAVLTDDLRATIQTQFLDALRKAGLEGRDL